MVTRIEARGLGLQYPNGTEALRGIDFALDDGELLCVLGPNGAGKSSLVRAIAGGAGARLRGELRLEGELRLSPRARARRIAIVPQRLEVPAAWRVDELLESARYAWRPRLGGLRPEDRDVLAAAARQAGIERFLSRRLGELSGGERQRVLLGRALAQDTPALVLDEPASSLDPQHRLAMFERLETLARGGRAVLVVTHDLNLAAQFATRILLLHEGQVHATGAAGDVLRPELLEALYGDCFLTGLAATPHGTRPWLVAWRNPSASHQRAPHQRAPHQR